MVSIITEREANVLSQLKTREKYGREIADESGGAISRAAVYVLLGRMRDKMFIEWREESAPKGESGPPRRIYRLTAYGAKVLTVHEFDR